MTRYSAKLPGHLQALAKRPSSCSEKLRLQVVIRNGRVTGALLPDYQELGPAVTGGCEPDGCCKSAWEAERTSHKLCKPKLASDTLPKPANALAGLD